MTTDTQPLAPTDVELMDLAHECELDAITFDRAVLTRWGQPDGEHTNAELQQMLVECYEEKKKCYFALGQHQTAIDNLIKERDALIKSANSGEPVAWMRDWDVYDPSNSGPEFSHTKKKRSNGWVPLYTPPPSVTDGGADQRRGFIPRVHWQHGDACEVRARHRSFPRHQMRPVMTDYALLKCAAEAMHNSKDPNFCNYSVVDGKVGVCLELGSRRGAITSYWNPLTDGGDALWLACALGLRVFPIARTQSGAACSAVGSATGERLSEVSDASLDTYTATRRAIVLAAAEMGKRIEGDQHGADN